jgi:hypothetical protein
MSDSPVTPVGNLSREPEPRFPGCAFQTKGPADGA